MTFYDDTDVEYRDPTIPYRGRVTFPPIDFDRASNSNIWVVDRSGNRKADLSTGVVDHVSWKLDDYGDAEFTMPVDDPRNSKLVLGQTEIFIEVGGEPWWGRVARAKSNPRTTSYSCDELLSYYEFRFVLNSSLTYTSMDQVLIAAAINAEAQSSAHAPYGSFNIPTGDFDLSGRIRSREYKREEHKNMLDLLKEFPTLDDGFDFGIEYDRTGMRQFMCYYPSKGDVLPSMVLEWGRNIVDFEVDEDASSLTTREYVTGGSNAGVKFEENYSDDAKAGFYGTRYEAVVSSGSELDTTWLADKARKDVDTKKVPQILPSITVGDDPEPVFGVVKVGDVVPVRISRGRVDINDNYRVVEISRDVTNRVTALGLAALV